MNLETGHMIPINEGEELPDGYYPVPADMSELFKQVPEMDQSADVKTMVALRQRFEAAAKAPYPPVPTEPPQPHRMVTLENGHKICPDCQQGMAAVQQPTGEQ